MTPTSSPGSRPAGRSRASRDDREIATLARALGHPARVEIMRLLIQSGDCICGQIVDVMPLAQATVSQHLKVLKDAGLVRGEVDGPRVCYCANPEVVQLLGERLIALARTGK
ncbi:MAG: metalloregulator ArsR/SmtB family transcription factor [Candidatus Eisenbacteria bacterium]